MTTFKILYFDGTEISRYMMNQPMAKDYQFRGIFCRRKNLQTQNFKYYLYTEDMETLILAAEKRKNTVSQYIVSMNANQMTRESKFYMGGIKIDKKSNNIAYSWHPQIDYSTRLMLSFSHTSADSLDIYIPNLGTSFLLAEGKSLDQNELENKCIKCLGTTQSGKDKNSPPHHLIFQNEQKVLDFYQTYEDEFSITIYYPFSLFQAFSMALSYIS